MRAPLIAAAALLAAGCATSSPAQVAAGPRSLALVDPARQRAVPVLLHGRAGPRRPLAILSHGYGSEPAAYSFIADALAAQGYLVAAIDHELPGDPPIPSGGPAYQLRMPNWRVGAQSIGFVIAELRARRFAGTQPVVLIGHSNGGDMAMLFATEQPRLVRAAVTLDNRRHPLPRRAAPRICSIRSADQPADPGVLPAQEEQRRHGMQITSVTGLIHNQMSDAARPDHQTAMLAAIFRCLGR